MLALIFLIGSSVLGIALMLRVMRDLLDLIECLLWGTVSGWLMSGLAAYLLARCFGELTSRQLIALTIVIWISAIAMIAWNRRSGLHQSVKLHWRNHCWGLAIILIIFTPVFFTLFWTHMFAPGAGGIYSGGSAAYDLSFHAALTNSFLYSQNFPPRYLFLSPEPLRYPFFPDFQTAVLITGHLSLRSAWIITSLVLVLSITALLYFLAYRITKSQKAATFATLMFLLSGGFGFINGLRDWWRGSQSFVQFWGTLNVNYTNNPERGLYWPNVITDAFLPQRAILFGLAISLIVFTCFAIFWERGAESEGSSARGWWPLMIFAGVLTGLLPIIHPHSFIAVGIAAACLFAFRPRWIWLGFWIPAIGLAAPQLIALVQPASSPEVVRLLLGWLGHDQSFAFLLFLLRNFGLPLVLAVPAWLLAAREWRKFYLAFALVLVFALTVNVSPNSFDNGKFIYYWHAVNSIFVGSLLAMMWKTKRWKVISLAMLLASVLSGICALQSERHAYSLLTTNEEAAAADFIRAHTAQHALFLNAPAFTSPVTTFAGRSVVRGPTAWLASHGYDFRGREADVRRIYAGADDALDLIRYYGIDYIFVGDKERELKANTSFFDQNCRRVYQSPNVIIYDTHALEPSSYSGAANLPGPRDLSSRLNRDPDALLAEFPRTSFFLYRLIKASFGRLARRDEFMTAMSDLVRGVSPGERGWEAQLQTNQEQLLTNWISTSGFANIYGQRPNAEFIDDLIRNAGLDWSAEERQELLHALDTGQLKRTSALSQVVADKDFAAREYNTAYVLMHFFGYLRRNPDDPPDTDLRGLVFWRERLDRWRDYRAISRAFLESSEYNSLPPAR